jgi:hypothetical protein
LWMASRANDSLSLFLSLSANGCVSTYLGLRHLQAQGRGAEPPREWAMPTGLGQPAQAHFGPFQSPLSHTWVLLTFCTLPPPIAPF